MSFSFPFFAFPFDWRNCGGFPGHGDRAHNHVPALTTGHHIPVPRCRLQSVSVGLSQLGQHPGAAGRVVCLQPLSTPHLPKIPNVSKHHGGLRRERSGLCWEEPCCAHLPLCPRIGGREVLALGMGRAWVVPKHPLLSHHPPTTWLWSGSHLLP